MAESKKMKTKRILRIELAKLLMAKNINQITVTELTERADIHRSTFYGNFEDINELHRHLEDFVIDALGQMNSQIGNFQTFTVFTEVLERNKLIYNNLVKFVIDNPEIGRWFFTQNAGLSTLDRLNKFFCEKYTNLFCEVYNINGSQEGLQEYIFFGHIGGLELVRKWCSQEIMMSKEDIVQLSSEVLTNWEQLVVRKFAP